VAEEKDLAFEKQPCLDEVWVTHASMDADRELVLTCYSNSQMASLHTSPRKSPYLNSEPRGLRAKGSSLGTRNDSTASTDSENNPIRHRTHSMGSSPVIEIYDSELDMTIISNGSDEDSDIRRKSGLSLQEEEEEEKEEDDFELLIEESNRDSEFLHDNEDLFARWEKTVSSLF
jgi:hypothetical protein